MQFSKTNLITVFKSCLNILRDNEGLTGEKALRNMSYLIILKLLEPRLDNEINIENKSNEYIRRQIITLKESRRNAEKYIPNNIRAFFI